MSHPNPGPIRIVAVTGSVRPGNFTSRALALATNELGKHDNVKVQVIDPADLDLPMPGTGGDSVALVEARESVEQATGIILATPEYHGSYSSVIKLFIDNMGFPSVLSGKPVALLGVAAGTIGAIKALEHLRSVCSHVGAIVLPGPVSVAGVSKLFDEEGRCLDERVEARIRGVSTGLLDYIGQNICPRIALEAMVRAQTD